MNDSFGAPFFGAYNARHINHEEAASQFVPFTKFWELIRLRNTLLVGPRGSGKTHLLKMLQPKSLAAWHGDMAEQARQKIGFWGVFVPADVNWRAQVDQRFERAGDQVKERFSRTVFLSHFREAFISCILQLTRDRPLHDAATQDRVEMSRSQESEFSRELASSWRLPLKIPSLDGLRIALTEETKILGGIEDLSHVSPYVEDLLRSNVVNSAQQVVGYFTAITGKYSGRWALCFDELEIAPESIQRELFSCLRATDQRFIFKLAISPYSSKTDLLNKELTASVGNDFDMVPLWFTDSRERESFCTKLWEKQAAPLMAKNRSPQYILAQSAFLHANDDAPLARQRYSSVQKWAQAFRELERKDKSFAQYLKTKDIRASALRMDPVVRKIAPLVGFRNNYLAQTDARSNSLKERSLSTAPSEIFSGWESLCTATEGNPRWFSGMASRLLLKWECSVSGKGLTRSQQSQEFDAAARKFLAWISAMPIRPDVESDETFGLRDLMESVGHYFQGSVLGHKFNADPVLSFVVDEGVSEHVISLLATALNIGAIVIMDDAEICTISDFRGKRFRLVHLLAPHYKIPLRSGKAKNLSSILEVTLYKRLGLKNSRSIGSQMRLFV